MIYCDLKDLGLYGCIHPNLAKLAQWLKTNDYTKLPPGKTEIDGSDLFALNITVDSYDDQDALYEVHQVYADVQVLVDEAESFFYTTESLREKQAYNPSEEAALYYFDQIGMHIKPKVGECLVFLPNELHLPKYAGKHQKLNKIIFKVKFQ